MSRYCAPDLAPFPALELANSDGLLAAGGDLSPERLLCAYSLGIFPWFSEGQPILWWSPDPRCVLYPAQFKTGRSLRKAIRRAEFSVTYDRDFEAVISACAEPRANQEGTWITPEMHDAYCRLHQLGCAHSVEVWQREKLVGGLYGIALGRIFYGESMFSRVTDASKIALKYLCAVLDEKGYHLIDCQVETAHLLSLGAQLVPREQFVREMNEALQIDQPFTRWS